MYARKIICATAIIATTLAASTIETRALVPRTAPAAQVEQKLPDSKISVDSALVNLDVLVTDQDGRVLAGLKRNRQTQPSHYP